MLEANNNRLIGRMVDIYLLRLVKALLMMSYSELTNDATWTLYFTSISAEGGKSTKKS